MRGGVVSADTKMRIFFHPNLGKYPLPVCRVGFAPASCTGMKLKALKQESCTIPLQSRQGMCCPQQLWSKHKKPPLIHNPFPAIPAAFPPSVPAPRTPAAFLAATGTGAKFPGVAHDSRRKQKFGFGTSRPCLSCRPPAASREITGITPFPLDLSQPGTNKELQQGQGAKSRVEYLGIVF